MSDTSHYEELRLALVLNGGVSLAVWIGGVCQEINRLVSREGAYRELLDLTETDVRADVICGTSAGSINGALLATSLVHGRSLQPLRDLWIERASFSELLRDPMHKDLPSLLDGDGYFLHELTAAFRQLHSPTPTPPTQVPMELILTTTLLSPEQRIVVDDLGLPIKDATHKATFRFSRGPACATDPFASDEAPARLALAARSSASFPGAFEASYCPVDATHATRPDMKGISSFDKSRWVIDGGVLVNKPIEPALKAIFAQRANREVRRVLFYVVPDPGADVAREGDAADEPPNTAQVVLASLTELPRVESVSDELAYIREHNRQVEKHRRTRLILTSQLEPEQLEDLGRTLFPVYRQRRIESAVNYILEELSAGLAARTKKQGLGHRGRREWLAQALRRQSFPWLPDQMPRSADPEMSIQDWRWGTRPSEMTARLLLDVLRRIQRVQSATRAREPELMGLWTQAFEALGRADRLRDADRGYWARQGETLDGVLSADAEPSPTPETLTSPVEDWFRKALVGWSHLGLDGEPASGDARLPVMAGKLMRELAGLLMKASELVKPLARQGSARGDRLIAEEIDALVQHVGFFVPPDAAQEEVVRRLLLFHLVSAALGEEPPEVEQLVELVQVSADTASPLGGPDLAEDKLAGIQLAHFGAFYKRSWRANDWMFGRLDAVRRVLHVLLHPGRLRALYTGQANAADTVLQRVEAIALGDAADAGSRAFLQKSWEKEKAKARAELAFLDDPGRVTPELLSTCVEAVTRRLHLEILGEELPTLANAAKRDLDERASPRAHGKTFFERLETLSKGRLLSAEDLVTLFRGAQVNAEKIRDEVGSDLFTATSTRALAVAVSAGYSENSGLGPLRKLFQTLRAPALVADLFARASLNRSGTVVAALTTALVFGTTVVGLALLTQAKLPGSLVNLAMISLIGGAVGLLFWNRVLTVVLGILGVVAFVVLQVSNRGAIHSLKTQQWRTLALVLGALLLLQVLGSMVKPKLRRRSRRARPPEPGSSGATQ